MAVEAQAEIVQSLCDVFPALSPSHVRAQLLNSGWDVAAAAEALLCHRPAAAVSEHAAPDAQARPRGSKAQHTQVTFSHRLARH
jgi:hypothetical protein